MFREQSTHLNALRSTTTLSFSHILYGLHVIIILLKYVDLWPETKTYLAEKHELDCKWD